VGDASGWLWQRLSSACIQKQAGSQQRLLQLLLYFTDVRPARFSSCLIQIVTFTLLNTTSHSGLKERWHYLYTGLMHFLSTLISPLHIFKTNVGFLLFPNGNVSVCNFSLIIINFFWEVRFSVKCVVPLSSLRPNRMMMMMMINSWSNKRFM